MNILLDTHALIWFANNDKKLPKKVYNTIIEKDTFTFISVASIWEISIKLQLNKLELKYTVEQLISFIENNNIQIVNISIEHVRVLDKLPSIHKDPFDRILIAQTIAENFTLITSDENINKYDVTILWN